MGFRVSFRIAATGIVVLCSAALTPIGDNFAPPDFGQPLAGLPADLVGRFNDGKAEFEGVETRSPIPVIPRSRAGPKRFFEPPIALADLPAVDAVLISHGHHDHLDMETVKALARRGTLLLVPLGVGAHLEKWGVAPSQFRELDWGQQATLGDLTITATPARSRP